MFFVVMVWDVEKLKFAGRLKAEHTDAVNQVSYVSVDGAAYVVSASSDRSIIMYKKKQQECTVWMRRARQGQTNVQKMLW